MRTTVFVVRKQKKCICKMYVYCESSLVSSKVEIEVSMSRILSMFIGEKKLFLSTVLTSQLLGAGHKTLQREGASYWLNREFVTGRRRKEKRVSSVFSGDEAAGSQGKGLLELFPVQCRGKKTIRVRSLDTHCLPLLWDLGFESCFYITSILFWHLTFSSGLTLPQLSPENVWNIT